MLVACQRDGVPALIDVKGVSPTRLEVGERMEIRGDGFPGGRTADIVFRGTLHRPGEEPIQGVALRFQGPVSSESLIELPITDDMEARFCGGRERLVHTTFRGEVEVSFSSRATRGVPVYGILPAVVLDFRPTSRGDRERAELEGRKVLALHGIALDEEDHTGAVVKDVLAGSRGANAGLSPGDRILSFDRVNVANAADIRMPRAAAKAIIQIRPAASLRDEERVLDIDVEALRSSPRTQRAAVLVFAIAVLLIVVFGPRYPRLLFWASHAKAALFALRDRSRHILHRRERLPSFVMAGLLLAVLASVPFSRFLLLSELDFALLAILVLVLHTVRAVRSGERGSLVRELFAVTLPLTFCLVSVCFLGGSLRLTDYSAAQGAGPWDWTAFSQPFSLALAVIYVHTVTATFGARFDERRARSAEPFTDALSASLLVIAFLGGWRLPYALEGLHSPVLCGVLSGLTFLGKTCITWALLVIVREARARSRGPFATRAAPKRILAISVGAVLCAAMGWFMVRYPIPEDVLWSLRMLTGFGALFTVMLVFVHGFTLRHRQLTDPLA